MRAHVRNLLLARRDQFVAMVAAPPVLDCEADSVIRDSLQPHFEPHYIESRKLCEVVAQTFSGDHRHAILIVDGAILAPLFAHNRPKAPLVQAAYAEGLLSSQPERSAPASGPRAKSTPRNILSRRSIVSLAGLTASS